MTKVTTDEDLIEALGPRRRDGSAIALVGGADSATAHELRRLRSFFARLTTHLSVTATTVVDGGTDSGVMRLIGEARAALSPDAQFELIGVLPEGALRRTTRDGVPIMVARHHTTLILVPGSAFGDESRWLFRAADHLAGGGAPTLVVNGGKLTLAEALKRLAAGRRVVTVQGSGRSADELAAAEDYRQLRASGTLRLLPLDADAGALAAALSPTGGIEE